jgi:hypothetical protein
MKRKKALNCCSLTDWNIEEAGHTRSRPGGPRATRKIKYEFEAKPEFRVLLEEKS